MGNVSSRAGRDRLESGILGYLSSVERGGTSVRIKICRHSCLRIG